MAAQPSGVPTTPPNFVLSAQLLKVISVPLSRQLTTTNKFAPVSAPGIHHYWQASSWTLCHWSQHFESDSSASFQSTSQSLYPGHALSYSEELQRLSKQMPSMNRKVNTHSCKIWNMFIGWTVTKCFCWIIIVWFSVNREIHNSCFPISAWMRAVSGLFFYEEIIGQYSLHSWFSSTAI